MSAYSLIERVNLILYKRRKKLAFFFFFAVAVHLITVILCVCILTISSECFQVLFF